MSLSRPMLKGMGLTEEQVQAIIDAHVETTDALKKQRDEYKANAEKLAEVQRQLDEATGRKDYKADYEKALKDLNDYKAEIAGKEKLATKKRLYRTILVDDLKMNGEDADLIMAGTDFGAVELDGENQLSDADGLKKTVSEKYKRYIPVITTQGAKPATPPASTGGSGANPRAAEIARQRHERLYGKPQEGANNK